MPPPPRIDRLAALERRPGRAEARPEAVVVGDVRLHFVPDAGTERQRLAHADVVLQIEARLHVRVDDRRIADPLREEGRLAGLVRRLVRERVRADVVDVVIRVVPRAVELDPRAPGIDAADVVQVRLQAQRSSTTLPPRRCAPPVVTWSLIAMVCTSFNDVDFVDWYRNLPRVFRNSRRPMGPTSWKLKLRLRARDEYARSARLLPLMPRLSWPLPPTKRRDADRLILGDRVVQRAVDRGLPPRHVNVQGLGLAPVGAVDEDVRLRVAVLRR